MGENEGAGRPVPGSWICILSGGILDFEDSQYVAESNTIKNWAGVTSHVVARLLWQIQQ